MDKPDPDEPAWKRKAIALEYWLLTMVVVGAFIAGLVGGVVEILR
jgi:hypothetical protein